MALSADEVANIANAALEFYVKGKPLASDIQEKPLYETMISKQKTFSGGKDNISVPVKLAHSITIQGYTHDDETGYQNPTNIRRAAYPWKEIHAGITISFTELKKDGIEVVDTLDGSETSENPGREMHVLSGILEDKLEEMGEGWARSFNEMLWLDGSQDSLVVPGIQALITDDPTTGVVGGIDRAANSLWQNRSLVGSNKITHSTSSQTLTKTLRAEARQLRRYGGRPSLILCGSGFIEKLENEVHEKGTYTQQGFVNKGKTDIGMAVISMMGVGDFMYDPTLDDLDRENFAYFIDPKHLKLWVMKGEDRKVHNPARPYNRYVLYRGMTWSGGFVMDQGNCHGVYEAA